MTMQCAARKRCQLQVIRKSRRKDIFGRLCRYEKVRNGIFCADDLFRMCLKRCCSKILEKIFFGADYFVCIFQNIPRARCVGRRPHATAESAKQIKHRDSRFEKINMFEHIIVLGENSKQAKYESEIIQKIPACISLRNPTHRLLLLLPLPTQRGNLGL